MENKLQELTQKLYDQGLAAGREKAGQLLEEAEQKAKKIVHEAEREAEAIRRKAEKEASDLHQNTLTELSLAGQRMAGEIKGGIADMIVARATGESVAGAMLDAETVGRLMVAVAGNWNGGGSGKVSLEALLPQGAEKPFVEALGATAQRELGGGLEVRTSDRVKSGFRISEKDGGYYIDFSDESFRALLGEYLRPKVSAILFGEKEGKTENK